MFPATTKNYRRKKSMIATILHCILSMVQCLTTEKNIYKGKINHKPELNNVYIINSQNYAKIYKLAIQPLITQSKEFFFILKK